MKAEQKRILILMLVALFLGYLPWYNYSAVMSYISDEFGFSSQQESMIVAVFQFGYVIIVLLTGWLADKVGSKRVVAGATLLTAIFSTSFVFLAQGFVSTIVLRLLTGLSAGAIYAPGMSLLSNWFSAKERGKAMGAYTAGMVASYAGGYFIASPLAAAYNWRVGMLATSVPVFAAAVIVIFFVREKPDQGLQFDGRPGESPVSGVHQPSVPHAEGVRPAPEGGFSGPVLLTASYMGHMWELYAFWGYIGSFMTVCCVQHGLSKSMGGLLAALIIISGAPAVYLIGLLADKWGRTKTISVSAAASLIPEFFFGYLIQAPLGVTIIVGLWIGFWVIADSAIYKAGLTDMASDKIRGTILGVQSAVGFSMTILAPLAFGSLLSRLNNGAPTLECTNWGPCFVMLGIGALFSPAFALLTRRSKQSQLMTGGKK